MRAFPLTEHRLLRLPPVKWQKTLQNPKTQESLDANLFRRPFPVSGLAHGLDDYRFVEGLAIAGRRTVVPRLWRWPTYWPVVLSATFDRLAVTLANGN